MVKCNINQTVSAKILNPNIVQLYDPIFKYEWISLISRDKTNTQLPTTPPLSLSPSPLLKICHC